MRAASREATNCETDASKPAKKNIAPAACTDRRKRWWSQSTKSDE
jgi:hypothetical protein